MNGRLPRTWVTLAASLGMVFFFARPGISRADDFFNLSATGSGGTTASAGGANLLNLTSSLINRQQAFSALSGQSFTGSLRYAGVNNALQFSENASQTQATLTIPSTGFTKTFNGTSSADLQNQVRDFIKTDGEHQYALFLQNINRASAVAAVDGNPQSSTAFISTDAFNRFGMQPTLSRGPKDVGNGFEFRVEGGGGVTRADGFNGNFATLTIDSEFRLTDTIALSVATAAEYRSVEGSTAYTVAEILALPITLIPVRADSPLTWQVSPWAFGALAASYDQAAGTILLGGGVTSSLSYGLGDFTFTLADQGSYTGDTQAKFAGYGFDVAVNQWIVKNGGKITWQRRGSALFIDAGIAYSNLLHNAAIPNYWTPTASIGLKFNANSGIRVGYSGDFAKRYNTSGGVVTLFLAF